MIPETVADPENSPRLLSSANLWDKGDSVVMSSTWGTLLPYFVTTILGILVRLPTLNNSIIFVDEPAYLAQAARLDSLYAFIYSFLYRTETKFQLGLVPYIFALDVSQPNAILIVRLWGLLAVIVSCCLMISISRLAFGHWGPGCISSVLWLIYLSRDILTSSTLLEYFQTPLVLLAVWFFIKALQISDRRLRYLLYAGIAVGLATLVKPPGIMLAPAFFVVLVLVLHTDGPQPRKWRSILLSGFALAAGATLPVALFTLPYVIQPSTFHELMFNIVTLASNYAEAIDPYYGPLQRVYSVMMNFGITNMLIIGLALALFLVRRFQSARKGVSPDDCYQYLFFFAGVSLFTAYSFGAIKAHYLIPVIPLIMLFASWEIMLLYRHLRTRSLRLVFASTFILAVVLGNIVSLQYYVTLSTGISKIYSIEGGPTGSVDTGELVRFVTANSTSSDYIWVYYNMPEIYWLANRKPATREPSAAWLVHVHTPFWFDRTYTELQVDKPKLMIGVDQTHYSIDAREPITELPKISEMLAQSYTCSDKYVTNAIVCIRKDQ
jgi:hypothetical protein